MPLPLVSAGAGNTSSRTHYDSSFIPLSTLSERGFQEQTPIENSLLLQQDGRKTHTHTYTKQKTPMHRKYLYTFTSLLAAITSGRFSIAAPKLSLLSLPTNSSVTLCCPRDTIIAPSHTLGSRSSLLGVVLLRVFQTSEKRKFPLDATWSKEKSKVDEGCNYVQTE